MTDPRRITHRGYGISYDPPPIPDRRYDWAFAHDDYDGAPDSGDMRCGVGPSIEDCKRQIDELEGGNGD